MAKKWGDRSLPSLPNSYRPGLMQVDWDLLVQICIIRSSIEENTKMTAVALAIEHTIGTQPHQLNVVTCIVLLLCCEQQGQQI